MRHNIYYLKFLRLLVFFLLTAFSGTSISFADTTATYGNFGDITVISFDGNYDAPTSDCQECAIPRQAIAKEFFNTHPDQYDFLIVFSNFDFQMPVAYLDGVQFTAEGFHSCISNSIQGIGMPIFDNTHLYGSNGHLKGMVDMGYIAKKVTDSLDLDFTETMTVLSHELLHQWVAYIRFKDNSGVISNSLLGLDNAHWSYLLDTQGSVMYGNRWQNNGNGTFTSLSGNKYYSLLDLYLMGMIDKSKVAPMLLIRNPGIHPDKLPDNGVTISGVATTVSIDDIIAAEGERVPSAAESQKSYKFATIFLVRPGTFNEEDLYPIRTVVDNWVMWFSALTDGQAQVIPDASPIEAIPGNPGVTPPPYVPRTLPPELADAVNWLIAHQQANGSWLDSGFTRHRDTIHAVAAVSHFLEGSQSAANGLSWLDNEQQLNTDALAGKISLFAANAQNTDNLKNALLAGQNPDGGWGPNRNYISNPLDTSFALVALSQIQLIDSTIVSPAIDYLKAQQNIDSGWGTGRDASDIFTTVNVISAFSYYKSAYSLSDIIQSGLNWLYGRQNSDGGFGNSPSTVYDTAISLALLNQIGGPTAKIDNALNYILGCQSKNGSWYDSPDQTALAVSSVFTAMKTPDLAVTTSDITLQPGSITTVPAQIGINVVVRNMGYTDVGQTTVTLYKGSISSGTQIGQQVISVSGRSSVTVSFEDTVTQGQPQFYYVVVDGQNQVSEFCETNNKALKILNAGNTYDFEILDSDVSVSPAVADIMQPVTITANIKNKGAANAYSVPVKFYVDNNEISSLTLDLPAGGTVTRQVAWDVNKSGNLHVLVTADPANIFPGELSETNNTGSALLSVNSGTKPNLSVSYANLTITPSPALQGGTASISELVVNNGFSAVNNIDVRFYAGEPAQGNVIGSTTIPTLSPGESQVVNINWANIQVSGSTVIYATVSTADGTGEISNSDNSAFITVNVLSLPDLFISPATVSVNPAIVKQGDPVRISVTVMNKGQQDAAGVTVGFSESGTAINTGLIDLIHGNSQGVCTYSYDTADKTGSHQIQIAIDPDNAIAESDKTNNSIVCGFAVEGSGESWLSESYISPNGDNIKDIAQYFFELNTVQTVKVNIVNELGETVRTFSGGALDNCASGQIAWDGLDDSGKVVPDGRYRINVIGEHGTVVAGAYVTVDNNRSSFSDVIGAPYFSTKNITCHIPGIGYNYNDGRWYLQWFSDESGLLFLIDSGNSTYPEGFYTISPDGDNINRLVPWEWQWHEEIQPGIRYQYGDYDLSKDDNSIVFVLKKFVYNNKYGSWDQVESQIWTVDRYGQNLRHVVTSTDYIIVVSYAPDRSKIAYEANKLGVNSWEEVIYFVDSNGMGNTKISDNNDNDAETIAWCPDNSKFAYLNISHDSLYLANVNGNFNEFKFNYIIEVKWLNASKLTVVDFHQSVYDIWMLDFSQSSNPLKIAEGIQGRNYYPYGIEFKGEVYPHPKDGKTFAFIDNSGESWVLRYCDDQGNCRVLHESPKVNRFGDPTCNDCYVSINDVRWSPDGSKLAFIDFAYQPLIGQVQCEGGQEPCAYTAHMIVMDLTTGEKEAYPLYELSAYEQLASYHFYTMNNGSWDEKGVLHYEHYDSYKSIDLPPPSADSQNSYKIRIEQRGNLGGDIDFVSLNLGGEEDYLPTSAVNVSTGENILGKILAADEISADASGQTLELTWENLPESINHVCRLSMQASEGNYSYRSGSLQWLDNHTLIASDHSRILIADIDTGKTDWLPIWVDGDMIGSPHGNYINYFHYDYENGCEGNLWSLSTLLNSPATLQVRRTASAFVLEGTAMDANFDHYTLEYADVESPNSWNLIAPPSDSPIIDGQFITWVPPDIGEYYVRLTVFDKAGNQVTARKKVSLVVTTVISSLYKTDVTFSADGVTFSGDGDIISPYTDSRKNAAALHYRVLSPGNLAFSVYDASGTLLKTYDKAYSSIPEGGTLDYIVWDGKDSNGNIVPDGIYTIKILDYAFYVQVDRALPSADIDLSEIKPKLTAEATNNFPSDSGWGAGLEVELTVKAIDQNLKSWTIEYGEGANPGQWIKYASGSNAISDSKFPFGNEDIAFLAGKTFRVTAEDTAGNISTAIAEPLEEQLILNQVAIPWDVWISLGHSMRVGNDQPWFMLGLKRDSNGDFIPKESVPSPYISPGTHTVKGLGTLRFPIVSAFLQSCDSSMVWTDAYEITDLPPDTLEFDLNTTRINLETVYAIRIKSIDETGNVHFSNTVPVRSLLEIYADALCKKLLYRQMIQEDLEKLQFQYKAINSSGDIQWIDYKVLYAETGVLQNGIKDLPKPDMSSSLRIIGTSKSNFQYLSNEVAYPPVCNSGKDDVSGSFSIRLKYNSTECNTLCRSVSLTPNYGIFGPPDDFVKITYYLLNSLGATVQTIGSSLTPNETFLFDISAIQPGAWQVQSMLEESKTTAKTIMTIPLIVDDALPESKITYPASSGRICPLVTADKSGNNVYFIKVEGVAQDNQAVQACTLYYGIGENPFQWQTATDITGNPMEKSDKVRGALGSWNVTHLAAGTYCLKLVVVDNTGNMRCDITSGFYLDTAADWSIDGVDTKLFSPNGDSICDECSLTYTLNENAVIKADILQGETFVQTLMPTQARPAGTSVMVWDDFSGPDGLYDIRITAEDPCGNRDQKSITGIEVDSTPPEVNITSPLSSDVLGVIVEITGTAMDKNFSQYRLEAISVDNPDHIITLCESDQPVANGLLGDWNNSGLSGSWQLHLSAKDVVGNSQETFVTITLGNRQNLIQNLSSTHNIISPNHDGILDQTEIDFTLSSDIAGLYNAVIEIRDADGTLKKTYTFSSISGGPHSSIWRGESSIPGEAVVSDGIYHVMLKASLASSPTIIQSESITVKVDSTLPEITIIKPSDNQFIKEALEITGSVSDANLKTYRIECSGPAGVIFSTSGEQNRDNYQFAYLTGLSDGDYQMSFYVEDMAGNHFEKQVHFTIDQTAPKIQMAAPAPNSVYGNTKDHITISGTIEEKWLDSWSLSYGAGNNPEQWIELSSGTTVPAGGIMFDWPVGKNSGIPDGIYKISLKVADKAGWTSESQMIVAVDNTAPVVDMQSPADNAFVKAVEIRGTISDEHLKSYTVELSEGACSNASRWSTLAAGQTSIVSGVIAALDLLPPDNTYCIRITAIDQLNNTTTITRNITIDNKPPNPPVLSGIRNSQTEIGLSWTQSSESDIAGYNLYRNGTRINSALMTGTSYVDSGLSQGVFVYTATAVDKAGWESTPSNEVDFRVDMMGPVAKIFTPQNGSVVGDATEIKGTAYSDNDFKEYRVYLGAGQTPAQWILLRQSPVPVCFGILAQNSTMLGNGAYYSIKVEAEDLLGNVSTDISVFMVDNQPPAAPVLLSAVINGTNVVVAWQANTETDLAGYLLYRNNSLVNGPANVSDLLKQYLISTTSYTDAGIPDGALSYQLYAVDSAGNLSLPSNVIAVQANTHAPHMTISADKYYFDTYVTILAQSADLDIAQVQFQYQTMTNSTWINIGSPMTSAPWGKRFDPKSLGLPYGCYNIHAVAKDTGGRTDSSPSSTMVCYRDLTKPVPPEGLAAAVNGGDVTLHWQPNTETDIQGYNIYRLFYGNRNKINSSLITQTSFVITGLSDDFYIYAVSAMDQSGNESDLYGVVVAHVYTPEINVPSTYVNDPHLMVTGTAAGTSSVEIFDNDMLAASITSDFEGFFYADLTLTEGDHALSAKATDGNGNISKMSGPVAVTCVIPPPTPTGLTATVSGHDCLLTWNPVTIEDLAGYNLYRNGEKVNRSSIIFSGTASASLNCQAACLAFDPYSSTGWSPDSNTSTAEPGQPCDSATGKCGPDAGCAVSADCDSPELEPGVWWQVQFPAQELITSVEIQWSSDGVASDFYVLALNGSEWVILAAITGNAWSNTYIPAYVMTDIIRIAFSELSASHVQINDVRITKAGNLITDVSYNDVNLEDQLYKYQVTSVDTSGLESPLSPMVDARIGDAGPPMAPAGLAASVSDMSVTLTWSPNTDNDLAGYQIYRNTNDGWMPLNSGLLSDAEYTDEVMANGQYQYRVTALDNAGNESQPSDVVTAIVDASSPPIPSVTSIVTTPEGNASYICWEFEEWSTSGFNIYRSLDLNGPYTKVNSQLITDGTCYVDKNLTVGQSYYYKVAPIDPYGVEGAYSDPKQVMPENVLPLTKPVILEPTVSGAPIISTQSIVNISGAAMPGSTVELYQNGDFADIVTAVEDHSPEQFPIQISQNSYIVALDLSPTADQAAYLLHNWNLSSMGNELWIINFESGDSRKIADDVGSYCKWSPQGDRIAYTVFMLENSIFIERIYIYDLSADTRTALTEQGATSQQYPAWSADGNRIAFLSQDDSGIMDVWLEDIQNQTLTRITQNTDPDVWLCAPSFSPDNLYLAYLDSNMNLYIVDLASGLSTCAETGAVPPSLYTYRWSLSGNKIAYQSYDTALNISVYDVSNCTSLRITNAPDYSITSFEWSSNGMQIVYTTQGTWVNTGSGDEYKKPEIGITPANVPDCSQTLLQLDSEVQNLFVPSSGAIWYIQTQYPDFKLYQWFPGRFTFKNVDLQAGENEFYALSIDNISGNVSPGSDTILINVDSGTTPDLEVLSNNIFCYPAAPVSGEKVVGIINVKNTGAAAAENVDVAVYITDPQGDRQLVSSATIPSIEASGTQDSSFDWDSAGKTGIYRITAIADPNNQILELSEINNSAEVDIFISSNAGLSMTTKLDSDCYLPDKDVRMDIQVCNSGSPETGKLDVSIVDEQGDLVEAVLNQHIELPYAYHQEITLTWNTQDTFAGQYRVKATFTDDKGVNVAENFTPFTISSDLTISMQLTTDKLKYGFNEEVQIAVCAKNNSTNSFITSAPAALRITDVNNNVVFSQNRDLQSLFPGTSVLWPIAWNTALNSPMVYTASAEVDLFGGSVYKTSKQFEISPKAQVSAVLTVPSGAVSPGDAVNVDYTIRNDGNIAIENLPVNITLVDPDTGNSVVVAQDVIRHMDLNSAVTSAKSFSTHGLVIKQYTVLLNAVVDDQSVMLASKPLVITDRAAPVVVIVSPEDSATYHSKFNLAVQANDADSGINGVEYQMDDGQWWSLPLANPSQGLYSIGFTPSGQYIGDHVFRFRATDAKGNVSSPVFTTIHIIPKLDISAAIDGNSFGMNADVPISIHLQNTGWQKNVTVESVIENSLTNEIAATLDPVYATVLSDAAYAVSRTWNTGISPPGSYSAHISIKYNDQILAQTTALFTVLPVLNLDLAVATDKGAYSSHETVHCIIRVTNNGNYAVPLTGINVTIADTDGAAVVYTSDSQIADLSVGQATELPVDWNTGDQANGNYRVNTVASVGGAEVNRQSADFSIMILDHLPPIITILSPVADSVYSDTFNLTVSAIDDISGVDTVEYQFGTGQWQPLLPSDSEPNVYGATFTPTQADEGDRVISFRAADKTGNQCAPISVHITIDLLTAFKSLTGTITASPHVVMPGMNVSYEYSISNNTRLDVKNLQIQVPITQKSDGQVIKTLQTTATVSAQSIYIGNFTDSVDFAPGAYTASLNISLNAPAHVSQLAADGLSVVAEPVVTVEGTMANNIRLLVWINDKCRLTCRGWKDCIRTDLLEKILKANLSDYHIVFDDESFTKELRNPYYTDIMILSDHREVEEDIFWELMEKINSGAGLIATRWIPRACSSRCNHMFGIKFIEEIPGNPCVTVPDSPITKAANVGPVGPSIRVEALNTGETIAGRFKIDKNNPKASPTIILNTYGRGKTVYFAFDLAMMLSEDKFGWISQVMANAFAYLKDGRTVTPVYPWQVTPVSVTVDSTVLDYPFRMIESFSDDLFLYDQPNSRWVSNSPQQFDVGMLDGEKTVFEYYYLAPNKIGTYPTETQAGILFNNQFLNLNTIDVNVTVSADRDKMIDNALAALSALKVKRTDAGRVCAAKKLLDGIKARLIHSRRDIHKNIVNMVSAIQEVVEINSANVSDVRYLLDALLQVEESRYYLYDLMPVTP